jgi:ADP-dependent NAD(P)H-hydrate dehydratase / NAD(P)H-hydrate epimerase
MPAAWAGSARPLSSLEMAVIEANAVALGVTVDALMENAGRAVAEEAMRHLPSPPARVAVIAGAGNNGGDATCATHYLLQWGYAPEVWLVRPPADIASRAARRCFERVARRVPIHVGIPRAEELARFPLVLDGLLGTGQGGRLRSPIRDAVLAIRESRAPTLAVDLPTGVSDPEGLRPAWTVTLTALKDEMAPGTSGEVVVRDIGIPPESWHRTGPGEFLFFPHAHGVGDRRRTGRVIVVGGGPYSGAPALAALAALRSGAERATVLAPEGSAEPIQSFSPNLVVRAFGVERFRPTDVSEILGFVRTARPQAVVLGMGAGAHPETVEALRALERSLIGTIPLVVDADGLAALPTPEEITAAPDALGLVATPNVGELERYFGVRRAGPLDSQGDSVRAAAAVRGITLLSKGDPDLISDGETWFENAHHHPAMTVGGAGDVLGGVVGSLLAQGLYPRHAARLGSWWTGEAGILVAARRSFGLTATDIVDELPAALRASLARLAPQA